MIGPHKAKEAVDAAVSSGKSSGGANTHAKKGADTTAATQENLRTEEEALGQRNSRVGETVEVLDVDLVPPPH